MLRFLVRTLFLFLVIAIAVVPFPTNSRATVNQAESPVMQLPDGYVYELIYHPQLAGLSRIVRDGNGDIFVLHRNAAGGSTVSSLDVDADQLHQVLDLPPWVSASSLVGGPANTFFITVDAEIRQVRPDGSYTLWGQRGPAQALYYSPQGEMLGIGPEGTSIVQIFRDGSTADVITGLSIAYDVLANANGTVFASDIGAGNLIRKDQFGSPRVIASITPDNTDLGLDADGNLYLNNAGSGFALVDQDTGATTAMTMEGNGCGRVLSPADFVFDNFGRAVFAAWTDSIITWVDFSAGEGGQLVRQPWTTTKAAEIGPDDALYLGINGCGSIPSRVVRFASDGSSEVYLDGLTGRISDIEFDSNGGLYLVLSSETSIGIYHWDSLTCDLTLLPDSNFYDVSSLAVDPTTDHLFASILPSPTSSQASIVEFSREGLQGQYVVSLPKPAMELLIDAGPSGTLYAFGTERERFSTGPEVDRWILVLDLAEGTSDIVFQHNRTGCCPLGHFSVDKGGSIWWLLNPDFLLYRIPRSGTGELFGSNLPVDAASVNRNSEGDIFLNTPEGIYRIWMPTLSERVRLIIEDVELLSRYGVMRKGHATALTCLLDRADQNLADQRMAAARGQLRAFLRKLDAYVRANVLSEERAAGLRLAAQYVIDQTLL